MSPETAYLVFGLTLTVALAAIAIFYFSRKRKHGGAGQVPDAGG